MATDRRQRRRIHRAELLSCASRSSGHGPETTSPATPGPVQRGPGAKQSTVSRKQCCQQSTIHHRAASPCVGQ
ncbi:hypothetical protein ZHAS_00020684 [Anopheles sinensis]|uniref:Uncharacterized protein n=1 Tax=Anopheles sinensis TaxID=74873 RepID=A0A084WQE2_ANOSI|nr:hypothetical protein ZHAS_00020684 [Anopheles sinensis]